MSVNAVGTQDLESSALLRMRAAPRMPRVVAVAVCATAALLALQIALVVLRLGGHFSYTLDDPYIHLALADQIAQGHYGLARGVAAAPSSSILFPVLLAALSPLGLGQVAPIALNAAATLASAALLATIAEEAMPALARLGLASLVALSLSLATGLNLVGLALTGMEHSVHVTLTLVWLLGASRFLRGGELAAWWWAAALLQPLLRYEGAALWLATAAMLAAHGRARAGAGLALAGTAALGAFSLFLHLQGLSYLPSSVLVKSGALTSATVLPALGPVSHILSALAANLRRDNAATLLAAMMALGVMIVRARRVPGGDRAVPGLATTALAVSAAHLAFGRLDGYSRYEIYVLSLDVAVLLMGFATEIQAVAGRLGRWNWVLVPLLIASLLPNDVWRSLRADAAARNIYEQQHQMHRLVAEFYRAPVAVNDLGQVSYRNPYPVLDLWGLGSEEARRARRDDPSGRWMKALADRHGVGLAMIYADCFAVIPAEWVPVARLALGSPVETAAEGIVTFYATGRDRVAAIDAALDAWAPTLPDGVRLDRLPGI